MNKKYIIVLSVLGGLLGVSLLVGVSYAYYMVSVSQTNKNIVKSSCLNLEITNEANVIRLEKQIPIMNSEGKDLTPYTFTITNTCSSFISYSLNLEELEGSTLASKYIMTMVNDKSYVNMASLSSADNYYANSVESRVLVTGSLGAKASVDYSLRLWMDEDTPLTSDAMNKSFRSKVVVVATPTKSVDFDYTGTEQVFTAPASGTYKLETWGAQGGFSSNYGISNYGGYSTGYIFLNNNEIIYINIGGRGSYGYKGQGGYNGGAYGAYGDSTGGAGGGYIGNSGLYSSEFNKNICGKGADQNNGGSKTQSSFGSSNSGIFGVGGDGGKTDADGGGGGGGLYGGGGCPDNGTGGGGSGYIGNSLLTNKAMYCYNCEESSEESTKTISTTCAEETPTSNCAKKGNGYARITYIGNDK